MANIINLHFFLGIPKSKSYASGLLDHNRFHDNDFPRPHNHLLHDHMPRMEMRTSQTVLCGMDYVWKGMGFHPGGTSLTTSDLSPFDEPEPIIHAWKNSKIKSPDDNNLDSSLLDTTVASPNESSTTVLSKLFNAWSGLY